MTLRKGKGLLQNDWLNFSLNIQGDDRDKEVQSQVELHLERGEREFMHLSVEHQIYTYFTFNSTASVRFWLYAFK